MNDIELAQLIARIQVGDNRQADRATLAHWREMVGDLDYGDALAAVVMHFRESSDYLTPAHVRTNCTRIRNERKEREQHAELERGIDFQPAPYPKNMEAWQAAWNDPRESARQESIYHQQCREANVDPHVKRNGERFVCYSCMGEPAQQSDAA